MHPADRVRLQTLEVPCGEEGPTPMLQGAVDGPGAYEAGTVGAVTESARAHSYYLS